MLIAYGVAQICAVWTLLVILVICRTFWHWFSYSSTGNMDESKTGICAIKMVLNVSHSPSMINYGLKRIVWSIYAYGLLSFTRVQYSTELPESIRALNCNHVAPRFISVTFLTSIVSTTTFNLQVNVDQWQFINSCGTAIDFLLTDERAACCR